MKTIYNKHTIIKKGQFITFSTGEYSDYGNDGFFIVLRDFNIGYEYSVKKMDLISHLNKQNIIKELNFLEFNESYGVWDFNKKK